MDNKISDNEIIKALEDYRNSKIIQSANGVISIGDILDLINRQKAKNEALEMDNAQLQSDNEHLQTEIERLQGFADNMEYCANHALDDLEKEKAEAIKEFAERLKGMFAEYSTYDRWHTYEILDRIEIVEEEMVGDNNEN